jgi:hypothetical protein
MSSTKVEAAFSLGFRSALNGEHVIRAPFASEEEGAAYNEGFEEGCQRVDDLTSDAYS